MGRKRKLKDRERARALLSSFGSLFAFPLLLHACVFSPGEYRLASETSSSALSSLDSLGSNSSTTEDDGAKGQCAEIDSSDPERKYCVDCYNNLLASKCPGVSDPDDCKDKDTREGWVNLVNQCVADSMQAGFTCTLTCSDGYTLDSASCSCVPSVTIAAGNTFAYIDAGQTDFGPPAVTAIWPSSTNIGTVSAANGTGPGSCTIKFSEASAVWLGIRNRSGTSFGLNTYGTPSASSSACTTNVAAPKAPNSTGTAPVGANAYVTFDFVTGGSPAVTSAVGGSVGWVKLLSGGIGDNRVLGNSAPFARASPYVSPSSNAWEFPKHGTRDLKGNIHFTDGMTNALVAGDNAASIRHFCFNTGTDSNYMCRNDVEGHQVGYLYTSLEKGGTKSQLANVGSNLVRSTWGIAVDRHSNVFFSDPDYHYVGVYCGKTDGICRDRSVNTSYLLVGGYNSADSTNSTWTASRLNGPRGIDIQLKYGDNLTNIFIADHGNNAVRVACQYEATNGPCNAGNVNSVITLLGSNMVSKPTDVKVNWNGNVFVADSGNHRILARCYKTTGTDLCAGASTSVITIAGTGTVGDTGDGGSATSARIASPQALAIAKEYADDQDSTVPGTFRDNNLAFVEGRHYDSASGTSYGNTVRMVCGSPNITQSGASSVGFCRGQTAGTIIRLSGQAGVSGSGGNDAPGLNATYANLQGITYDLHKNIWVSSTGCGSASGCTSSVVSEFGIRAILLAAYEYDSTAKNDKTCGIKYSFTDSNQQSSYYCLKLNPQTQCLFDRCECAAVPPNNALTTFWTGSSSTGSCP